MLIPLIVGGAALILLGVLAEVTWWLVVRADEAKFEREMRAWRAGGGAVITIGADPRHRARHRSTLSLPPPGGPRP